MVADKFDTTPLPPLTLVLGGARSGKSAYAERLIEATGGGTYLATADMPDGVMRDAEMQERVRLHQARRGDLWRTVEEPVRLADALRAASEDSRRPILVDCLTLWLSNLMAADRNIEDDVRLLIEAMAGLTSPVVMVSSEVGLGIVPENALARRFRDEAGRMNERLANVADRVIFVAAGLPLIMKG